jgi:hypothetical protein
MILLCNAGVLLMMMTTTPFVMAYMNVVHPRIQERNGYSHHSYLDVTTAKHRYFDSSSSIRSSLALSSTSGDDEITEEDLHMIMSKFFQENWDWHPVFRNLAADESVLAIPYLSPIHAVEKLSTQASQSIPMISSSSSSTSTSVTLDTGISPQKRLQPIPTNEHERKIIADCLDVLQQILLNIPCTSESKSFNAQPQMDNYDLDTPNSELPEEEDDEFDKQFIDEGRRILALTRFQVVSTHQELFSTCWNEICELVRLDEPNTGSLIVFPPDCNMDYLQTFQYGKLQQPLTWLGLDTIFDLSTVSRGTSSSPALRMLHKWTPHARQVNE